MRYAGMMLLALFTVGCDLDGLGEWSQNEVDLPQPESWMIPDGEKVDIGGEVVEIVGADRCNAWLMTLHGKQS